MPGRIGDMSASEWTSSPPDTADWKGTPQSWGPSGCPHDLDRNVGRYFVIPTCHNANAQLNAVSFNAS